MDPITYCEKRYGKQTEAPRAATSVYYMLSCLVELIERSEPMPPQLIKSEPMSAPALQPKIPVAYRIKRGEEWGWTIPTGAPGSVCKCCLEDIVWVKTSQSQTVIPLDEDGTCHFETCTGKDDEEAH